MELTCSSISLVDPTLLLSVARSDAMDAVKKYMMNIPPRRTTMTEEREERLAGTKQHSSWPITEADHRKLNEAARNILC